MRIKDLYEYAREHGMEDYHIAVSGIVTTYDIGETDGQEFMGLATEIDPDFVRYIADANTIYPAVWLCCGDCDVYPR